MKLLTVALAAYLFWDSLQSKKTIDIPGQNVWSPEQKELAGKRAAAIGVKLIMLGRFESTSTPGELLRANAMNPHLATLVQDLATSAFTFLDRPKQFYRAMANEWIHDITLERYINQ